MKSIAQRLVSGSGLRMVNLFAQIVVATFMVPFMVHELGDRMYGLWVLVGSFLGYYGVLDLGMSFTLDRHVARAIGSEDYEECNRTFNTGLLIYSALGLLVFAISMIVAVYGPRLFGASADRSLFSIIMVILGVSLALDFPLKSFGGILNANLRFDILVGIQLLSLGLRTAAVVFALKSGYGLVGLAWAVFLSSMPGKLLHIRYCRITLPSLRLGRRFWNKATARSLFSFSTFVFIARVSDMLRYQTAAVVISAFVGLAAVTHYKIAGTLIQYFIKIIIACMGVTMPVFSQQHGRKDLQSLRKLFFFSTRIAVCITVFISFGLIAWGRPFIERWMSPSYLDAYPSLVLLTLATSFALSQANLDSLLYGIGKQKLYAMCMIADGVLNLIFSLLLVRRFGITGVAVGAFIPALFIRLAVLPVLGMRAAGIPVRSYYASFLKTLFHALVSLAIPLAMTVAFAAPGYLRLLAVGLGSLAAYAPVVWLLEFDKAETLAVRRAIAPIFKSRRVSMAAPTS